MPAFVVRLAPLLCRCTGTGVWKNGFQDTHGKVYQYNVHNVTLIHSPCTITRSSTLIQFSTQYSWHYCSQASESKMPAICRWRWRCLLVSCLCGMSCLSLYIYLPAMLLDSNKLSLEGRMSCLLCASAL